MQRNTISTSDNLQVALTHAAAGLPVFPVNQDKRPLVKWKAAATTDLGQIRRWFAKWPDAMPAIPTGEASGLAVLDLDRKDGKDGFATMAALGFDPEGLSPVMVATPKGGGHLIFRHVPGLRSSAGQIGPGVDVRAEGGFVVAAGAVNGKGVYRLLSGSLADDLPPWPEALMPPARPPLDAGQGEPTGLPFHVLNAALMALPNDGDAFASRDEWLRIGMALHAESGGSEEGQEAWHDWSRQWPGYDDTATDLAWESFHAGRGVTGWTIIHEAETRGWSDPALTELRRIEALEEARADFDDLMTAEEEATIEALIWGPPQGPTESLFSPASAFAGQPVKPRRWLVPDLIPAGDITMLGGDGGTGKSLLALQLAVAVATEGEWIDQTIGTPGKVMFLSAEDDMDELHRRLASICHAGGLGLGLLDNLLLLSRAGGESLLAVPDKKTGSMVASALYGRIDKAMAAHGPALLVLDTLADLHSGNENDRAHVRPFVQMLRGLAIRHGAAVLLLAHPSLTGIANGSGLSGNTAWNNSVRSRLYLKRDKDEGGFEANPDTRVLESMKANYAGTGSTIRLRWRKGVFTTDLSDFPDEAENSTGARAERVFLSLLDAFKEQGRYVSANSGQTFAPALFAKHPDCEGCTKRAFGAAMESLFTKGQIRTAQHGSGAKARSHIERVSHGRQ